MGMDRCKTSLAIMFLWILFQILGVSFLSVPAFSDDLLIENPALEQRFKALEDEIKQLREEADVRKKLAPTENEETEEASEILSAAGRQYTLLKKNTLGVEYRFAYSYNSFDIITQVSSVEQEVDHTLTNSMFLEYGFLDNLAFNFSLPFVYKYDRIGTEQNKSVTDIGDVSLGLSYQPLKSGGSFPTTILFGNITMPSGRSPYEIDIASEISTGSGAWALSGGASFSKTQDPVVVYGTLLSTYFFPVTDLNQNRGNDILREVKLGHSISASMGLAFSISYKVSLNLSYSYTYGLENEYDWVFSGSSKSGATTRSSFSIGTGWRVSPKTSISFKLNVGLTSNDPDFSFSCRVPFNFDLSKKTK